MQALQFACMEQVCTSGSSRMLGVAVVGTVDTGPVYGAGVY